MHWTLRKTFSLTERILSELTCRDTSQLSPCLNESFMCACFNFVKLIWNCSWYFKYKLVPGTLDLSSFLPVHQNDDQIFSSFIFSAQSTPFIKRLFRPLSYPIEFILGRVYFQSFGRSVERRIGAITFARREQSFTWQRAETLRSILWGIPRC